MDLNSTAWQHQIKLISCKASNVDEIPPILLKFMLRRYLRKQVEKDYKISIDHEKNIEKIN